MSAPLWLTARPIAHRGLHERAHHVIENTLSAARAAIDHSYAIECDVQLSRDGEVFVFHDDHLDRLTEEQGRFNAHASHEIKKIALRDTRDSIPTLAELLDVIGGRVPLICEIKSSFDGTIKVAEETARVLSAYHGPVAIKSFDPQIVIALNSLAPERPRGFIGESVYDDAEWDFLTSAQKHDFATLVDYDRMRPDFLSWYIKDLDQSAPQLARRFKGLPVMTWTIRTKEQRARAERYADQIVFEGFHA